MERGSGRVHRALGALTAGLVALAVLGPAAPARASDAAEPLGATELAARVYPGVQLVSVDFEAELRVPAPQLDAKAVQRLQERIARQILTGTVDTTERALVDAIVDAIAKDPLTYFKPTRQIRTTTASLSGFGTGWVVTPDGYIVTAAHVVTPDLAELKEQFALTALGEWNQADAEAFVEASGNNGAIFDKTQISRLVEATTVFNARYLEIGDVSKQVSAQIGIATAGFGKSRKGAPVEVVAEGEAYPGKDVALLKLDGETALPTLPVGQDSDVREGETLFVAGYPAASTFLSGLSKDSEVQPTVTQGPLTAIKSNEAGTPVFQTQAPASPGNSGGPVLDDAGRVVGILVASAVDDKGVALENQEFVVPISVVSQMLRENNVTPRTSPVTEAYDAALADYYRDYYSRALPQFERVRNLYGAHPYVGKFISDSQSAIDAGKDRTPRPVWFWVVIGGAVLVVLAGAGTGAVLLARRGKRRPPTGGGTSGAPPYAYAGAPQGYPPQQATGAWAPPQGRPQGYPPQGYPQPAYPQPGYPQPGQPQGQPPQGPPQGYPPQGYPQQPQGWGPPVQQAPQPQPPVQQQPQPQPPVAQPPAQEHPQPPAP